MHKSLSLVVNFEQVAVDTVGVHSLPIKFRATYFLKALVYIYLLFVKTWRITLSLVLVLVLIETIIIIIYKVLHTSSVAT